MLIVFKFIICLGRISYIFRLNFLIKIQCQSRLEIHFYTLVVSSIKFAFNFIHHNFSTIIHPIYGNELCVQLTGLLVPGKWSRCALSQEQREDQRYILLFSTSADTHLFGAYLCYLELLYSSLDYHSISDLRSVHIQIHIALNKKMYLQSKD